MWKVGELCGFRVALHVKLDDTWGMAVREAWRSNDICDSRVQRMHYYYLYEILSARR